MDYRILIDKFFSGTTSREEEEMLRRYLNGENLPADIQKEKELLLAMLQPVEYDCTEEMAEVAAMIDSLAAAEANAGSQSQKRPARTVFLRTLSATVAAAAVLALMLVAVRYNDNAVQVPGTDAVLVAENVTAPVKDDGVDADESFVLSEPPIQLLPPKASVEPVKTKVQEPDKALLAKADEAENVAVETVAVNDVLRSGSLDALLAEVQEKETGLIASLGKEQDTGNEVLPDMRLRGINAGYIGSLHSGEDDALAMAADDSAVDSDDTFRNPKDAVNHIDALFAIFSDAASNGMKEQEMHMKQFVAFNDK